MGDVVQLVPRMRAREWRIRGAKVTEGTFLAFYRLTVEDRDIWERRLLVALQKGMRLDHWDFEVMRAREVYNLRCRARRLTYIGPALWWREPFTE